jgi:hypothetical protein
MASMGLGCTNNMAYEKTPSAEIKRTMDYKREGIEKAQRSTQDSIRVSSSLTNAVNIATARDKFKTMTDKEIEEEIVKWRKWLFDKLSIEGTFKELTEPF